MVRSSHQLSCKALKDRAELQAPFNTVNYNTKGLSAQERRARLAKVAKAITHPAIPEEERHHLYVNIHHGHLQGANKCKGDQRYCATCLQTTGARREETVMHASHECPTARAVWTAVGKAWEAATTESLDATDPILTVLGLRPEPPHGASDQARDRYASREPAWRLLHAVTLLRLHQAPTRAHMAYHDPSGPREPRQTKPRHILRAIRQRCALRLDYEHAKATHMRPALSPSPARGRARGTPFRSTGSPPEWPP